MLRHIGFSVCMFALVLLALEMLLRLTHLFGAKVSWSEPDPLLGYRFVPNRAYWFYKENDHPIEGKINSYGWRDREWSLEKPEGTYRVAVLGDSFVEAFAVESDRTFLSLAETQFNEAPCGLRLEMMNFGRSGYTQTEERIVLERDVLRFSPDAVILCFYSENDIHDANKNTADELDRAFFHLSEEGVLTLDTSFTQRGRYRIRCWVNKVKGNSALISLVGERVNAYIKQRRIHENKEQRRGPEPEKKVEGAQTLCTDHPDAEYLHGYRITKALIRDMAEICRERNIAFMLVVLPDETYLDEPLKELMTLDPTFRGDFFERDLGAYSTSLGIDFLGLYTSFRKHFQDKGESLTWGHFNYEGHRMIADILTERLRAKLCSDDPKSAGSRGEKGGA